MFSFQVTVFPFTTTCGSCRGSGKIIKVETGKSRNSLQFYCIITTWSDHFRVQDYCLKCEGSGVVDGVKNVNVSIPAGALFSNLLEFNTLTFHHLNWCFFICVLLIVKLNYWIILTVKYHSLLLYCMLHCTLWPAIATIWWFSVFSRNKIDVWIFSILSYGFCVFHGFITLLFGYFTSLMHNLLFDAFYKNLTILFGFFYCLLLHHARLFYYLSWNFWYPRTFLHLAGGLAFLTFVTLLTNYTVSPWCLKE